MWYRKLLAFLGRDIQVEKSYRLNFIMRFFSIFMSTTTFFFISKLFGNRISPMLEAYGGDYFSFVLIGIAFSGFLSVGLSSFSGSISDSQSEGTLEAMLVTPTKLSSIVLFSSIWSFMLTSISVLAYLVMGAAFFGASFAKANILAAIIILFLTIMLFSGFGILSASFIMIFKRGDPINWLFGSISSLLGGTMFPVTVMPVWLQKISYIFPLYYALKGMRQSLLMGYSVSTLLPEILILTGMTIVIVPFSLWTFKRAVIQAKVDGSLGTY